MIPPAGLTRWILEGPSPARVPPVPPGLPSIPPGIAPVFGRVGKLGDVAEFPRIDIPVAGARIVAAMESAMRDPSNPLSDEAGISPGRGSAVEGGIDWSVGGVNPLRTGPGLPGVCDAASWNVGGALCKSDGWLLDELRPSSSVDLCSCAFNGGLPEMPSTVEEDFEGCPGIGLSSELSKGLGP